MTPSQLTHQLTQLIEHHINYSVMIWGPPGVGKSSIVQQVAELHQMEVIDVRLNQLSPMDLRGVPVPENKMTTWFPPEFLPRDGKGILFLDEMNMAPPVMQGLAQQLVLERQLGSYKVPKNWLVWSAGNRKQDKATVFDMPAPLANRFLHFEVSADLTAFKQYAYRHQIDEIIIGFLSFRPSLLHDFQENQHSWPSPRSWEMANGLIKANMDIRSAVGKQAANEYQVFSKLAHEIPDIKPILKGKSPAKLSTNPSVAFATITSLSAQADTADKLNNAASWLSQQKKAEWFQAFALDAFNLAKHRNIFIQFSKLAVKNSELMDFMGHYIELMDYE